MEASELSIRAAFEQWVISSSNAGKLTLRDVRALFAPAHTQVVKGEDEWLIHLRAASVAMCLHGHDGLARVQHRMFMPLCDEIFVLFQARSSRLADSYSACEVVVKCARVVDRGHVLQCLISARVLVSLPFPTSPYVL